MHRWALLLLALSAASCGGFQLLPNGDGAATDRDLSFPPGTDLAGLDFSSGGNVDFAQTGGGFGPGPYGALPTGYCCTGDTDCRDRSCVDFGGGKMCSDGCDDDSSCNATPGMHCVGATVDTSGVCQPIANATACVPASSFHYGGKKLGNCCVSTHDGHSGADCEGGRCDASGAISNPYICTNVCRGQQDCPGNFTCVNIGPYMVCVPVTDPYTCN